MSEKLVKLLLRQYITQLNEIQQEILGSLPDECLNNTDNEGNKFSPPCIGREILHYPILDGLGDFISRMQMDEDLLE